MNTRMLRTITFTVMTAALLLLTSPVAQANYPAMTWVSPTGEGWDIDPSRTCTYGTLDLSGIVGVATLMYSEDTEAGTSTTTITIAQSHADPDCSHAMTLSVTVNEAAWGKRVEETHTSDDGCTTTTKRVELNTSGTFVLPLYRIEQLIVNMCSDETWHKRALMQWTLGP